MIDSLAVHAPQIRGDKLRALAVTTRTRQPALPEVPTFDEAGVRGFEYVSWMGLAAPAATPREAVESLNRIVVRALHTAEAEKWFAAEGAVVVGDSPADFARFIRAEYERWGALIRESGIRAE